MAYPDYPLDKCPYPVRDSYSGEYTDSFKPIKMDTGRTRNRRLRSAQPFVMRLQFHMTFSQLEYFEAWLKWRVAEAIGYFNIPLWPGADPTTVRLIAYPEISFDPGAEWVVDCSVERILPGPTVDRITQMNTFPAALPMPEKTNYTISRPDHITRSQIKGGLSADRNRDPDSAGIVQMKWFLTPDEKVIWDDFVRNKLLGGLAPFKGWFTNGRGAKPDQIIQFIEPPKETTNGADYEINVKAQTMLVPVMSYLEFIGTNNLNEAENIYFNENGSVDMIGYHDGTWAEFDYTADPVQTF